MPRKLTSQARILSNLTALQQPDSGQAMNAHFKSLQMTFICFKQER